MRAPTHPHLQETYAAYWTSPQGRVVLRTARYGREGSLSPVTVLVYLRGRWITPLEQKRRGLKQTLENLLRTIYRLRSLKTLVFSANPLLSRIPKEEPFCGTYVPVPIGKPPSLFSRLLSLFTKD